MRKVTHSLILMLAAGSLAACHRSTPSTVANVTTDNAADANAIESASGPDDINAALPADANLSADANLAADANMSNATSTGPHRVYRGNTDHRSTPHGNTDH